MSTTLERHPVQAGVKPDVQFPTLAFPSYPSDHTTISGAASMVARSPFFQVTLTISIAAPRQRALAWAAFHFATDNDVDLAHGQQAGHLAADAMSL
jgi:hypothetical protein